MNGANSFHDASLPTLKVFHNYFAHLSRRVGVFFFLEHFVFLGSFLDKFQSHVCVCIFGLGFREFLRTGAQASAENARWLEALTTGAEEASVDTTGAAGLQGDSSSLGADAANLAASLLAVAEEEARSAAPAAAARAVVAAAASAPTTTGAPVQDGTGNSLNSSSSSIGGPVRSDGLIDHFPAGPQGGNGGGNEKGKEASAVPTTAAVAKEPATPLGLEEEDSGVSSNDSLFAVNVGGVDDEGFGRWADDDVAVSDWQVILLVFEYWLHSIYVGTAPRTRKLLQYLFFGFVSLGIFQLH